MGTNHCDLSGDRDLDRLLLCVGWEVASDDDPESEDERDSVGDLRERRDPLRLLCLRDLLDLLERLSDSEKES